MRIDLADALTEIKKIGSDDYKKNQIYTNYI